MASTTKGTIFYYYTSATPATATQIYGMMTKPPLPGMPNNVESTSQEDLMQNFVAGVTQLGDANFQFKYEDVTSSQTNIELFIEQETAGKAVKYGIKYPHGKAIEFEAIPFVQLDGTGVNALDTFTVAMHEIRNLSKNIAPPATIVMVDSEPAG